MPKILDLSNLICDVNRIGYPDEGLRLTFFVGMPYDFHTEVQMSRKDVEWLISTLTTALADPVNDNLPVGVEP